MPTTRGAKSNTADNKNNKNDDDSEESSSSSPSNPKETEAIIDHADNDDNDNKTNKDGDNQSKKDEDVVEIKDDDNDEDKQQSDDKEEEKEDKEKKETKSDNHEKDGSKARPHADGDATANDANNEEQSDAAAVVNDTDDETGNRSKDEEDGGGVKASSLSKPEDADVAVDVPNGKESSTSGATDVDDNDIHSSATKNEHKKEEDLEMKVESTKEITGEPMDEKGGDASNDNNTNDDVEMKKYDDDTKTRIDDDDSKKKERQEGSTSTKDQISNDSSSGDDPETKTSDAAAATEAAANPDHQSLSIDEKNDDQGKEKEEMEEGVDLKKVDDDDTMDIDDKENATKTTTTSDDVQPQEDPEGEDPEGEVATTTAPQDDDKETTATANPTDDTASSDQKPKETAIDDDVDMKTPDADAKTDESKKADDEKAETTSKEAGDETKENLNAKEEGAQVDAGEEDAPTVDREGNKGKMPESNNTSVQNSTSTNVPGGGAFSNKAEELTTKDDSSDRKIPEEAATKGSEDANTKIPSDCSTSGEQEIKTLSKATVEEPPVISNDSRRERKPPAVANTVAPGGGPITQKETETPTVDEDAKKEGESTTDATGTTADISMTPAAGESKATEDEGGPGDLSKVGDDDQKKDEPSTQPESSETPAAKDGAVLDSDSASGEPKTEGVRVQPDASNAVAMDIDSPVKTSQEGISDAMDVDTPPPAGLGAKSEDAMAADVKKPNVDDRDKPMKNKVSVNNETAPTTGIDSQPVPVEVKKPIREIPTWIVESESEDEEDGVDAFQAFSNDYKKLPNKVKKRARKKLKISFSTETITRIEDSTKAFCESSTTNVADPVAQLYDEMFMDQDAEEQLEDSLVFFQVPHEDQDPAYAKFEEEQEQKKMERALKQFEEEEIVARKQIETYVAELFKEKQASTDRSVDKYKQKATADLQKDMQRLLQMYKEKSKSNQDKINQGMQVLRKRHQTELQRVMQQHRQQVQQRRIPEQMATQEWASVSNKLHAKHQKQLQEFSAKGEEVKTRCEADYQRDQTKLRSQQEKRHRDIEQNRKAVVSRFYGGIQQLRQRYIKRHLIKMQERKKKMLAKKEKREDHHSSRATVEASSSKETAKAKSEERAELRSPSPIKTTSFDWCKQSTSSKSGAAARHKHRKGVLSQTPKHLSVEIHNEGLWIKKIAIKEEQEKSKKKEVGSDSGQGDMEKNRFIPWGVKAREALESIILGEIPHGLGMDVFDLTESTMATGGHVRCVMTDLRTSEETASSQRAVAIVERKQVEMLELEKRAKKAIGEFQAAQTDLARISNVEKDAAVKLQTAQKDSSDKRSNVDRFREKFGSYLGADDKPLPTTNPGDRQKLMAAAMKYKTAAATAIKRENECSSKLAEAKSAMMKQQAVVRQKQAEASLAANELKKRKGINKLHGGLSGLEQSDAMNPASVRVADTISAFDHAANKRREQLDKKRHNNTSSAWVQTLPGVPGPLRKSLWYKMHRRRQQIVLRPSPESIILDLRNHVEKSLKDKGLKIPAKSEKGSNSAQAVLDEAQLRAEQSLLLAIHPVLPPSERVLATPSSSSSSTWAEPGYYLELQSPKIHETNDILPRAELSPLVQRNLSEIHSAPGRQAAALVRTAHLRCLETPLSSVAIATSLSETNPAVAISTGSKETPLESDPLYTSEQTFELGYKFTNMQAASVVSAKPAGQRNPSITNKPVAVPQPSKAAPKRKQPAAGSNLLTPTPVAPAPVAPPGKRRKSATQKKKAETKQPAPAPVPARRPSKTKQQQAQQKRQQQAKQRQQQTQQRKLQQQQQQQQQQPKTYMQQPPNQQQQQPPKAYNQYAPTPQQMQQMQQANQQPQQYYQQQQGQPPPQQQQQQYQRMLQQMHQQQQQQQQQQQRPGMGAVPGQSPQNANPNMYQQQPPNPGYGQGPPRGMQQMPAQFYQQQQFAPQPMPMAPGQPMAPGGQVVGPPGGGLPMNLQGNPVQQNRPSGDDQNDPLFILNDL